MAVTPNLLGFVESAGLAAVAYGPDSLELVDEDLVRNLWKPQNLKNPIRSLREGKEVFYGGWAEMSTTLTSLADGADLILTSALYHELAANVAEHYDIALVLLHTVPVHGQFIPILPSPWVRPAISGWWWWVYPRLTKEARGAQRRTLGLPKVTRSRRRVIERESLEIQAYDKLYLPRLAPEWNDRRPCVGALALGLATDTDAEVLSWIAAGTPPICFGFGSVPIGSPADLLAMIGAACAQLGERALVCSGSTDFSNVPHSDDVKVVGVVNYAAIFPSCRAAVHHGGAGTTAAGLRAGIPTLVLWITADQPIWAAQVRRLKVGSGRRFSTTTEKSLVADLRRILTPPYVTRAREIATQMTKPAASVTATADLLEETARLRRFG